ncbi:hypothetical protein GC102_15595 [Paenibacillus sp. LMG 31460]|uniref:CBM-cenC domain-containing protein n=1 Tax=Paenibacillus germinis TaxID=2654979 RepID=A0ABX1Z1B9_9BACL|nr:Ig-like domain-containing protein [Paenibacillus germinis]NOU87197.1 hypothetical protein [Paenibacillus germinis]
MAISMVGRSTFSKWLLGLLALLCLAFYLPSNVQAAEAAEIIPVPNSGFEQDLVSGKIPSWGYFSAGIPSGLSLSETTKIAGNRSLKMERTGAVAGALGAESVKLAVTPGKSYEAAVKLYIENFTGTPALWIRWHDAAGKPLNKQATYNISAPPLNKWLDIRAQGIAPADAAFATVFVYASSGTTMTAYVDEAQFYRVADTIAVINPGFEDPTSGATIPGWGLFSGTPASSVSISKAVQNSGLSSLLIDDTYTDKAVGLGTQAISVKEDGIYEAKASVYLVSGGGVSIYIKFYNASGKEIGTSSVSHGSPLNTWKQIKIEGIAPDNAATAQVLLYSGVATLSKAYFDDVSFTYKGDALKLPFKYGNPVDLGKPTITALTQGGTIGNNEVYFVANGNPGTFYAVDAATGKINFSQAVPGTTQTWAVTVGSDKNVYFAASQNRGFWKYDPIQKVITSVGNGNPSDNFVWDLDASSDGLIYGGTSPNAKVFSYKTRTNEFVDLGRMHATEQYARGVGVSDRYLYTGIGSLKHLMRMDRITGERTEITLSFTGKTDFVHNIWPYNGLVYIVHGTSLSIMDEQTLDEKLRISNNSPEAFDGYLSPPSPYNSDLIYYRNKNSRDLWTYNVSTNTVQPVTPQVKLLEYGTKAINWITLPDSGDKVLATLYENGYYTLYNPQDNSLQTSLIAIVKDGVDVQSLAAGPDGKLYLGGFIDGMTLFNQSTQSLERQMSNPYSPHQIEEIGFLNGKTYFGNYGGARINRFDASLPYEYGETVAHNPGLVYTIPNFQDRPYAFASGDNKLFIGTIPGYGELGGSLTTYDDTTKLWSSTRNVVQNQSIIALAYKNGIVYGGTSVEGGLGSTRTAATAKLFKWNAGTNTKLDEFVPAIPGISSFKLLGGLSFGPDGLLWGGAWGIDTEGVDIFAVYALNPDTNAVVKNKLVYPGAKGGSQWRGFYLRWGQDGLLYTTIARNVTVFDLVTLKYRKLTETQSNLLDLGVDGSIYYTSGPTLFKLQAPLAQASISMAKVTLDQGQSEPIISSGVLENGLPAILAGGTTSFTSSDPTVLSVVYGEVKALKAGTANVYADITLGGSTIRTNTIEVTVYQGTSLTVNTVTEATYSDTATLSATLTDLQGQPFANRSVQFSVDGVTIGSASTNAQGVAVLSYVVTQGATTNMEEAVYEVRAVFERDDVTHTGTSEGKGSITVKRETASVAYTGTTSASVETVKLAAHVSQQEDGELGSIAGLPIQFTISQMNPDGSLAPFSAPALQVVYQTDVTGNVYMNQQLPAGLYQVKTELLMNSRYAKAESNVTLAVYGSSEEEVEAEGWFAITEGNTAIGSKAKKVHIEAEWEMDEKAKLPKGKLKIHAEPKGLKLELKTAQWLVVTSNSVYIQGQAMDDDGISYMVRLMIGKQQEVVSLQIWQGLNAQGAPFYQSLGQKWSGNIKLK